MAETRRWIGGVAAMALLVAGASQVALAKTKLRVHIVDYTEEGRQHYLKVVAPGFEAENPDVTVELEFSGWSQHLEKLTTWFVSGVAPDVIQIGAEDLGYVVTNRMALPLDGYLARWGQLSDFPKPVIVDGQGGGHQYTVPYRIDQRTLVYRRDLFLQAGLDPERPPTTWDELVDAARRLTKADGQGRITLAGFNVGINFLLFAPFLFQAGGSVLSEDLRRAAFNQPAGVEAMQFLVDLCTSTRSPRPPALAACSAASQPWPTKASG